MGRAPCVAKAGRAEPTVKLSRRAVSLAVGAAAQGLTKADSRFF